MIVDFSFYTNDYKGSEADATSFPALEAHASRMIAAMTRFQVDEESIGDLPHFTQTLYKLAVCSQIDYISINGLDSLSTGEAEGFSLGKLRIDGKKSSTAGGAMSINVSPAAITYLEQTGLMNPQVGVWQC